MIFNEIVNEIVNFIQFLEVILIADDSNGIIVQACCAYAAFVLTYYACYAVLCCAVL